MAMNLTSNKAKIVWITFVDGKEKKSTLSVLRERVKTSY